MKIKPVLIDVYVLLFFQKEMKTPVMFTTRMADDVIINNFAYSVLKWSHGIYVWKSQNYKRHCVNDIALITLQLNCVFDSLFGKKMIFKYKIYFRNKDFNSLFLKTKQINEVTSEKLSCDGKPGFLLCELYP